MTMEPHQTIFHLREFVGQYVEIRMLAIQTPKTNKAIDSSLA